MTLDLFYGYKERARFASQVKRAGDEDDVFRRNNGQVCDSFGDGVCKMSPGRWDVFGGHGARIRGRGDRWRRA